MKSLGAQLKKWNPKVTGNSSGYHTEQLQKADKHDNSLILLQGKLTEDIRIYLKEITAAFSRQMKTANAWSEELKAVGALADTWSSSFSSHFSGAQQLAQSLKRVSEYVLF